MAQGLLGAPLSRGTTPWNGMYRQNQHANACFGRMDSSGSSPAGIAREDGRKRPYDPRVHPFRKKMDCRVKPGNDTELDRFDRNRL